MSLARGVALRLYGLLFRLLTAFVPRAEELEDMLDMLDEDEDERFL
jgi:hypothetical protein